jgi:fructokinase
MERAGRGGAAKGLMSMLFTTIGEILMDFTPLAGDSGHMGFQARAGGSPANVAVGLARLGARAEFAGKVSTDFFGRYLVQHLEKEGVGTRFVSRSPAHSTLAFVAFDHGDPSFAFYRAGTADTQLRSDDLPRSIDESDVLHFGSISLLAAPTSETVLAQVDRLRGTCLLSLDPNVRPSLIGDADAYRRTLDHALRAADILKISTEDLKWLMPGCSPESAAAQFLALGPVLVIVTLGRDGCYARMSTGAIRVPAPRVDVADTVGAGDAFSSGLLVRLAVVGLTSRRSLEQASSATVQEVLEFATATAALTCTRTGADPPRRDEVEQFLRARPGTHGGASTRSENR